MASTMGDPPPPDPKARPSSHNPIFKQSTLPLGLGLGKSIGRQPSAKQLKGSNCAVPGPGCTSGSGSVTGCACACDLELIGLSISLQRTGNPG